MASSPRPPLAERMRPRRWSELVGQQELVGPGGILTQMLRSGSIASMILWGPPGVGKTTIARLLSEESHRQFYRIAATTSGVGEVRQILAEAERGLFSSAGAPIVFIDEIHRFNKAQQDALLDAVERGTIILIGATTENPSFEIVPPLLSRVQVFTLKHLRRDELLALLKRAITTDDVLRTRTIVLEQTDALLAYSGGDARKLLNALEAIVEQHPDNPLTITDALVRSLLQQRTLYDKHGEMHYDVASALIKSIRGSDPDAAAYWLAVMLDGGEDPLFIARRLVIAAAEDIGLANPNALPIAVACFEAAERIGMPEARIVLAETAIYLALSPKSNTAYMAIERALDHIRHHGASAVPLHLRNAPTPLMSELGYAQGYRYPHAFPGHWVEQQYLPDGLENVRFYLPSTSGLEPTLGAWKSGPIEPDTPDSPPHQP
ncbi:MAG: ATPase AAA [Candidatus Kapaibacterium sp.]|nr:MAG: ATPase AAA [Candidatus Kapabacteria bacterium]